MCRYASVQMPAEARRRCWVQLSCRCRQLWATVNQTDPLQEQLVLLSNASYFQGKTVI